MVVGLPGFLNNDQREWFAERQAEVARQDYDAAASALTEARRAAA